MYSEKRYFIFLLSIVESRSSLQQKSRVFYVKILVCLTFVFFSKHQKWISATLNRDCPLPDDSSFVLT
jgi:type III secretory pathway component EscS